MLARLVRLALLLELAAYAILGAWLHSRGADIPSLAAAAIAFALAARLGFVVAAMSLSALAASEREPAHRIGWASMPRLVLGEYRAVLANNFFYVPFEEVAAPSERAPERTDRIPVVLVHGYLGNRGFFGPLLRSLDAHGVAPLFAPNLPGTFATIERFADELQVAIERIARETGQPKVILVCHSMGGLAARHYLACTGANRVAKLITIASPHAGTALAVLGLGANARQMRRDSAFVTALARGEEGRAPCAMTSIYSPHDNLVSPQDTCRLAWARNIALPGLGHIAILSSPAMRDVLLEELREAGVRTG